MKDTSINLNMLVSRSIALTQEPLDMTSSVFDESTMLNKLK